MNSKIRDLAGLGHDRNDALSLSFALADVRVEGGLPADQVLLFFSTPGMLVVAPLPDGSFRLVAEVDDAPEQPDVAYAQRLLNTRGPRRTTVRVTKVIWGSTFRIHERVADQYRAGRVLLAATPQYAQPGGWARHEPRPARCGDSRGRAVGRAAGSSRGQARRVCGREDRGELVVGRCKRTGEPSKRSRPDWVGPLRRTIRDGRTWRVPARRSEQAAVEAVGPKRPEAP
jgi:hypothetical protein